MATKGKRPMRALTLGDKIEAITRVKDGESKASVARDIGVPESTLRGWCKNEDKLRYMTSRRSSPETDKSSDGEPPDKRARTESPAAPPSPATAGLDLTTPATTTSTATLPVPPHTEAPVELTTRRAQPSPPAHPPRERRPDPGASVSMSAISPLSGMPHLSGLTHSHLGASFNEIATNLTLLAQLNPGLSALSAQPASRALRSVRSPKPAHNGLLNLSDNRNRNRTHHSDLYRHSSSRSHHGTSSSVSNQSMDDPFWYWVKTQQAMIDLTAQATAAHPLQLGKSSESSVPPQPVLPAAPINSQLDYNRNSWIWQYCKQLGGAMPLPDDKHKSASQVPKDKNSENILYSQLTKGKDDDVAVTTRPMQSQPPQHSEERQQIDEEPRVAEPAASPGVGSENKEPTREKTPETGKNQTKARTVLDSLLFNNNQYSNIVSVPSNGEWETGTAEALEHGDKFLAWLEASGDPSVTRMHVHQLRALLYNLRARRVPAAALPAAAAAHLDHPTRRK